MNKQQKHDDISFQKTETQNLEQRLRKQKDKKEQTAKRQDTPTL
jgi:hypothetical protein